MEKDTAGSSSQLSDEASEPDPGLVWWKGWTRPASIMHAIFNPPPGVTLPGEIEEVRIRRTSAEGSYMLQLGVRQPDDRSTE